MSKIKHKTKPFFIAFFVALVIVIGGTAFCIMKAPIIKGHLYSGDHIVIDLTIFLDGKEVSLDNLSTTCRFENEICRVTSENGIYKTSGGEYGEYQFELVIPSQHLNGYEKDINLNLNYINSNDWYISKSDCIINLYTDGNGILSGNATINTKYNDNTSYNNKYDLKLIDHAIKINWGL